jgi:hypothetical protein
VATLAAAHQAFTAQPVQGLDPKSLPSWAKAAGSYFGAAKDVAHWASNSAAAAELTPLAGYQDQSDWKAGELTTQFRAWAKGQSLEELRSSAKALGMDPQGASRAQVQNWIAATWDPALSKPEIQAGVAAKVHAAGQRGTPSAAPAPHLPEAVTSTTVSRSAGASVPVDGSPPGSVAAKHQGVVAALKAHQAVMADLPPRPTQAEVQAWSFGPGQSAALGGAHHKTLHAAPDGSLWLFKPDSSGGARAAAEAAASQIYQRVGIPSVGVYTRTLEGKVGSLQPLVSGASTLAANPKSWSQADVDAMVRLHVGAWGVGDHDANHTNVLRTPSGGLLPVDGGQAFKIFGSDRLDCRLPPQR